MHKHLAFGREVCKSAFMHIRTEIDNLERHLILAGVSLKAVLADACVDRSTWSRWKSDRNSPRMKNWQAVMDSAAKLTSLSAGSNPTPDSITGHGDAASPDPIREIAELLPLARDGDDHSPEAGGAV